MRHHLWASTQGKVEMMKRQYLHSAQALLIP